MSWLLALLTGIARESLNLAKLIIGLSKVALLRVALSLRAAFLYLSQWAAFRAAFLAATILAFETAILALAYLLGHPISSSVLQSLIPDNEPYAQGLYYIFWEDGVCFSTAWTLTLAYWGNVLLARRALSVLASALSYRIMVWNGHNQVSLGLLSGR